MGEPVRSYIKAGRKYQTNKPHIYKIKTRMIKKKKKNDVKMFEGMKNQIRILSLKKEEKRRGKKIEGRKRLSPDNMVLECEGRFVGRRPK